MNPKLKTLIVGLFLLLAGCNRDLSPLNSAYTSWQPTPSVNPCAIPPDPYMWADMETPPGSQTWGDVSNSWGSLSHTGCHSWKIHFTPLGWGHYFGYSFYGPSPAVPPSMGQFQMSFLIDQNLDTNLYLDEATSGDEWTIVLHLTASSSWQTITLPLSSFGGATGIVDTHDINQIWFFNVANTVSTNLYIDDIRFVP